jgi:23S rRNA (guanine2445-N2)-methyltransferase / 23S rRNA (guanine2069-N7)-methyltransferase
MDIGEARPRNELAQAPPGLLCVNPPYGTRIPGDEEAANAHRAIGTALRGPFANWHAAVLTGEPALGQLIGCEASRVHTVWNGAIECRLLRFAPGERRVRRAATRGVVIDDPAIAQGTGAQMFANRLRKNLARLGKIARREQVGCWRLYDADMPEYALAVDLYTGAGPDAGKRWLYVQEYAPPATVDAAAARRRREEALAVLPEVTGVPLADVRLRTRRKQKEGGQYAKRGGSEQFHVVDEAGLKLRVNLDDYLDTGLFLDHRATRMRIGRAAAGKRFLNLFCYTGVATVHAAAGGAASSLSIDMSRTYLDWTAANLELNGLAGPAHQLLQADAIRWLAEQPATPAFDLIFLDPPTFSNSARMQGVLDIQRDHAMLIEHCMRILAPDGLLLFSTNARYFQIDTATSRFRVSDVSKATLPFDFHGNPRIHRCYEIRAH